MAFNMVFRQHAAPALDAEKHVQTDQGHHLHCTCSTGRT